MSSGIAARARAAAIVATGAAALVGAAGASAHAEISPTVVAPKTGQVFALAVPTEKEDATTTKIELTPPPGFSIDSFAPAPGWKREVRSNGTGEQATIQKVTWSGGKVPTGEDALFQFVGSASAARTYAFSVRQTYSDGSVVDWTGPESSDTPAPVVKAGKLATGGGTSTLSVAALAVAVLALIVGGASLLTRGGRSLT
jgi:uncharacterized protein YcnI